MGGFHTVLFTGRKFIVATLILVIVFSDFGNALIQNFTPVAEATQVAIETTAATNGTSHLLSGSQTVFINDQTGYKFFRDQSAAAAGPCVYKKTTDGGTTWGSPVTVDSKTVCIQVQVWYDRWTPGDTGTNIHIATFDTTADDIFYNRLDTTSDTLLMGSTPVSMVSNTGQGGTIVEGQNTMAITKGTDGTVYATTADASDQYIVECTTNCNLATGWTETGTNPLDSANDYSMLMPLASGNIMLINRSIALEDIRSKIWNNTSWSGAWTTIDANATDNITYDVGMSATVSSTTPGRIYFAYTADNVAPIGATTDVRTAIYNGSTWATSTNVISNSATRGVTGVAIGVDAITDDVYVAYSAQTTPNTASTGNIYWKTATSSMKNWSTEVGPINSAANDMYGVDLNIASDQRIFASWFDNTNDDVYGDTIADIFAGIHATSTGSQIASMFASTSNVYIGGAFALSENYTPQDVTDITITESGTIDGANDIQNIKLFYEMDTSYPYTCASESYAGSESQFGSTDTNGFSGADGVASFTGSTVNVSTTSTMCVYPVMTVLDSAQSSSTIDISIANPTSDIGVTNGTAGPSTSQNIPGTTLVYNDTATLAHFHWRNDDGNEAVATSKTGGVEDTTLGAMKQGSTTRLRMEVSNEGSSSTPAMQYRLEYGVLSASCADIATWTDVSATDDAFNMYDTANLLDGGNTTNISVATGGTTDINPVFLTPNAAVKDTSSQTANITLSATQFVELEYSIVASTTAQQGTTYCFRVTNQGSSIPVYTAYPSLTINADVSVGIATSSQTASVNSPTSNFYVGSAFVIKENSSSRNVTSITLTETGSVDAQNGLVSIKLLYDQDTTAPYDCADQPYAGTEPQFGSTDTDGFSSANGTSTFTDSVGISTTNTLCVYAVMDVKSTALNGETINLTIQQPSSEVLVSGGGSVSPSTAKDLNGSTTVVGPVLTLMHYHWRADNGSETTATSLSVGVEDTLITNVAQTTPIRLRVEVSNAGAITSASLPYRLEYGTKITTCSAVTGWTDVGTTGGAWDMYNSANITEGTDTTDIAVGTGGVTNSNTTFLTPNSAVKDTSSNVASTTLSSTQFIEAEYAIKQTADAGYDTPYCFRLTNAGAPLNAYTVYPELTTSPDRDFEIQRGTVTITGTSTLLTAGLDYVAPSASTSAFIRITNVAMTGAGNNAGAGAAQNASNVTTYIVNPSNIMSSVTIARATGATSNTRVSWEIVEFIGDPGSDNEMIVRSQAAVTYVTTATTSTGTVAVGVVDDADVVVFITGQHNPLANSTAYNTGLSTSAWSASTDRPVFTRGSASANAVIVSYAVVEFKGQNWFVQRSEHTYTSAGSTETEPITAVNSLSRTFIHTQKRVNAGLNRQDQFGHEVWLSSIGYVSYFLESGSPTPSGQTSVAWIIENTQTTAGAMEITRSNGSTNAGTAPLSVSVSIGKTLTDLTNASIFTNARSAGAGTTFPIPMAGITIASSTAYELWRSNTGGNLSYRTEIVEWPTAGLAFRQNYYRFYVDNNAVTPTDPWPVGGADIGENTVLTAADEPLGDGEHIRLRMSVQAVNATFPTSTKAFRLQFGAMVTTCSAIPEASWKTVGDTASSTAWRGYNATGTTDGTQLSGNPPTLGDLKLSVSDVAGSLEEQNDTGLNQYPVPATSDIEYDWILSQNGASAETYYCFRMIESDNTKLDGYLQYPQVMTASFTPRTQNWRWYDDEINETPVTTLAAENVAPIDINTQQAVKLRVTAKEIKNISRDDVRFKLQYSEYANFSTVNDVTATSSCIATSTWCYANGGGVDNTKITTGTLSDAESCVAGVGNGCGTHNETPTYLTGFRHSGNTSVEYEFTIQSIAPRVNRVYYFRLFDIAQGIPVTANTSEVYPSLVTKGAALTFTMAGLASTTVTEGVTLDVDSTPTSIAFGSVPQDTMFEAGHRLTVDSNGTEGYKVMMMMNGELLSSSGSTIKQITGTNAVPTAWNTGCDVGALSCFGYHSGDDTLENGSTRFSALDTYAKMSTTTLEEVLFSSQPVANETNDIVFRIFVRQLQDAGQYVSKIQYISTPLF
jgi:hypothetical protein